MMKKYPVRILAAVLCMLACSIVLVSCVTAADCDNPKYPSAMFTCRFPEEPSHPGNPMPDGPPYSINCYDQSHSDQDITSWKWEFGDGGTSTKQSPGHTYSDTGSYQIMLTVTTKCGSYYSSTAVDSMDVYCTIPEPQFTVDVDKGVAPLTVHVHDSSINTPNDVTKWNYWYDNAHNSIDPDPIFVFTRPGIYTIKQTVKKDCVRPGLRLYPPFEHKINVTAPPLNMFYFANTTTTVPTTTVPKTTTRPFALQTSYALVTTSRTATASLTPVTAVPSGTVQSVPAAAGTTVVPGTGTLSVITDPSGARVSVDDVLRGASPATVPNLPAGAHTLRLEKEGYRNMTVPVAIDDGKTTDYSTALVPESGGMGMLPLIAGAVVILVLAAAGAYLYSKKKKAP
jgi:hypothetical protein